MDIMIRSSMSSKCEKNLKLIIMVYSIYGYCYNCNYSYSYCNYLQLVQLLWCPLITISFLYHNKIITMIIIVCLSVCLSVCLYNHNNIITMIIIVCLSVYLYVCLRVLSVCLCVYLSYSLIFLFSFLLLSYSPTHHWTVVRHHTSLTSGQPGTARATVPR